VQFIKKFRRREAPTSFSLENLQFLQIDLARWWHFEISDLFGGNRLELLCGGALKFLIYSVGVAKTCPVAVH